MNSLGVPIIECPNASPTYWKDDNNIAQKISYTICFVIICFLLARAIKNLRTLLSLRKERKIQKLFVVNMLILILYINFMVFLGDGVVALFIPGGYLTLGARYIVYYQDIIWLKLVLGFSYITWAPLLTLGYDISPTKLKRSLDIFKAYVIFMIVAQIGFVWYFFLAHNTCSIFDDPDLKRTLFGFNIIMMITALLNNIIFVMCCIMITKKVKELFDFRDQQSIKYLKILAPLTLMGTLDRAVYNILQFFPGTPLQSLEAKANEVDSYWPYQVSWAVLQLVYYVVTEYLPTSFLLINFSPYVNKKESDLREPLSSASSSIADPSIVKGSLDGSFNQSIVVD